MLNLCQSSTQVFFFSCQIFRYWSEVTGAHKYCAPESHGTVLPKNRSLNNLSLSADLQSFAFFPIKALTHLMYHVAHTGAHFYLSLAGSDWDRENDTKLGF